MDVALKLRLIHGTSLLFETKDGLWGRDGLNVSSPNSGNSLWKKGRPIESQIRDYDFLERIAIEKSFGVLGIDNRNQYTLDDILETYYGISSEFKSRSSSGRIVSNNGCYDPKHYTGNKIVGLLNGFLSYESHIPSIHEKLYECLHLDMKHKESIISNYSFSIAVLLMLGAIPPCLKDTRFRCGERRLKDDTETAFGFLSSLLNTLRGGQSNPCAQKLEMWKERAKTRSWCRMSLIIAFTETVSFYSVMRLPSLIDEYNKPLSERIMVIPESCMGVYINQGFRDTEQSEFYRLAQRTDRKNEYYLYYFVKEGIWESSRYDLTFYRDGTVHINTIDYFYKFCSGISDYVKYEDIGSYRIDNHGCLTIKWDQDKVLGELCLTKISGEEYTNAIAQGTKWLKKKEFSIENIKTEARLWAITTQEIILETNEKELIRIRPNKQNQLEDIHQNLTPKDGIWILLCGSRKVLFIERLWKVIDISTPFLQALNGLTYGKNAT